MGRRSSCGDATGNWRGSSCIEEMPVLEYQTCSEKAEEVTQGAKHQVSEERVLSNRKRALRNASVKSSVKTAIRRYKALARVGAEGSTRELSRAFSAIDKAVKKGVLLADAAARRKSRLAKKANKATSAM